jgi:hypothetical protein
LDKVLRQEARAIGLSALNFTRQRLTETVYAIPEDRTKKGKKKWRRTGNLRRSEKFDIREGGLVVAIVNTASYSVPRHEAGKPGHRNINPLRISHWRDDLLETFQPSVLPEWRDAVLKVLREHV